LRDESAEEPLASDLIESLLIEARQIGGNVAVLARSAIDRARLSVRKLLLWIAAGILGTVAVASLLVKASILLLEGLADGLSTLFVSRAWMGSFLAGVLVFVAVTAGVGCLWHSSVRRLHARIVRRYAPAPPGPPAEGKVRGAA
jgi:hypothetical protein